MGTPEIQFEYETAYELLARLQAKNLFLTTRHPSLNKVLKLQPGKCYELDGDIATGKTQICYSLVANFLLSKKAAKVGWISAIPMRTDHFCRHLHSANTQDLVSDLLERIVCKRVEKVSELCESLNSLCETVNMHFVIVENIDALLHDTAYDHQMGRHVQTEVAEKIHKLTRSGITVVVTNHITHWRGYPAPALGKFWASQIVNRFFVERPSDASNVRSISTMKDGEEITIRADFDISDTGLKDVE